MDESLSRPSGFGSSVPTTPKLVNMNGDEEERRHMLREAYT